MENQKTPSSKTGGKTNTKGTTSAEQKEEDEPEDQVAVAGVRSRSINLDHMQGIFFVLFLGYVASAFIFAGEVVLARKRSGDDPGFD